MVTCQGRPQLFRQPRKVLTECCRRADAAEADSARGRQAEADRKRGPGHVQRREDALAQATSVVSSSAAPPSASSCASSRPLRAPGPGPQQRRPRDLQVRDRLRNRLWLYRQPAGLHPVHRGDPGWPSLGHGLRQRPGRAEVEERRRPRRLRRLAPGRCPGGMCVAGRAPSRRAHRALENQPASPAPSYSTWRTRASRIFTSASSRDFQPPTSTTLCSRSL